jgi:hypothetical protein
VIFQRMPACGVCNIALRNFDKCVGCFLCGIKQHLKCLELEDDSFKFVSTLKNLRFVCDECLVLEGSSKMDRIIESVSKCTTLVEELISPDMKRQKTEQQSDSLNKAVKPSYAEIVSDTSSAILKPKIGTHHFISIFL